MLGGGGRHGGSMPTDNNNADKDLDRKIIMNIGVCYPKSESVFSRGSALPRRKL